MIAVAASRLTRRWPFPDSLSAIASAPSNLQPDKRQLLKDGATISLRPRAFDLLVALVERAGHLVTKDEFWRACGLGRWSRKAPARGSVGPA